MTPAVRYRCFECQTVVREGELHRYGVECKGEKAEARNPCDGCGTEIHPQMDLLCDRCLLGLQIATALREIALVAGELHAVRQAGFTEAALHYPRSVKGLEALCAFNGIKPEQAPRGWCYWPNAVTQAAWERVIDTLTEPLEIRLVAREAELDACFSRIQDLEEQLA